jgi:hypothetical protein
MELRERFKRWLRSEVGSSAAPALRRHLLDRGYRLFACMEHGGTCQREVYHPERGFFRAAGANDHEALLGILRQIWLVNGFEGTPSTEVGPAADR